ncbi:MAG: hypothetical protein HY482_00820 [Candidatus Wildermuthbacteria bacterium]|nr:hypothetical protein [Candidatus Wildermuthbacteria bacterium]
MMIQAVMLILIYNGWIFSPNPAEFAKGAMTEYLESNGLIVSWLPDQESNAMPIAPEDLDNAWDDYQGPINPGFIYLSLIKNKQEVLIVASAEKLMQPIMEQDGDRFIGSFPMNPPDFTKMDVLFGKGAWVGFSIEYALWHNTKAIPVEKWATILKRLFFVTAVVTLAVAGLHDLLGKRAKTRLSQTPPPLSVPRQQHAAQKPPSPSRAAELHPLPLAPLRATEPPPIAPSQRRTLRSHPKDSEFLKALGETNQIPQRIKQEILPFLRLFVKRKGPRFIGSIRIMELQLLQQAEREGIDSHVVIKFLTQAGILTGNPKQGYSIAPNHPLTKALLKELQ